DGFVMKLENVEVGQDVGELITVSRRKRRSVSEAFLFVKSIPILTDRDIDIIGVVQRRDDGFHACILDNLGIIQVNRAIKFRLGRDAPPADLYKWKVKNDDSTPPPRGEITDHRTMQDPEHTKYEGEHFVECFAIRENACIARSRQNVVLKSL